MSSLGQAVKAGTDTYSMSSVLDDNLGSVPSGSNILVTGSGMTQKNRLALNALNQGQESDQPVLLVTSEKGADRVLGGSIHPKNSWIVDCSGSSGRGSLHETANVKYISSPKDLTGIGMSIVKCTNEIGDGATNGLRLGVTSVSTFLQYTSVERVFNFTHLMTGRIASAGYLGVWTLDPDWHDDRTNAMIRGQFDYVAEIQNEGGVRVTGGDLFRQEG